MTFYFHPSLNFMAISIRLESKTKLIGDIQPRWREGDRLKALMWESLTSKFQPGDMIDLMEWAMNNGINNGDICRQMRLSAGQADVGKLARS